MVKTENKQTMNSGPDPKRISQQGLIGPRDDGGDDEDSTDSDSSDYLSFDDIDDEESDTTKEARERERQLVLEAAGLVVNQDVKPPPRRRPAPAAPQHVPFKHKDLPPVPDREAGPDLEVEKVDHEASLDDAFARYESFRNSQFNPNRLSVISTDSVISPVSPTATISSTAMSSTHSGLSESSSRYTHFLQFLKAGSKTPPEGERKNVTTLNISAPMMNLSASNQSTVQEVPSRSNSPSFGMVRPFFFRL